MKKNLINPFESDSFLILIEKCEEVVEEWK